MPVCTTGAQKREMPGYPALSWILARLRGLDRQIELCCRRILCGCTGLPRTGRIVRGLGPTKGTTFKCHFIKGLDGDPKDLFYKHMFLDTAKLADIVLSFPEVDENRAGVTGASGRCPDGCMCRS